MNEATRAAAAPLQQGYASAAYAASGGDAALRSLPGCNGQLLISPTAIAGLRDAGGSYPVFSCARPAALADDLATMTRDVVTLSLVPDPLLDFDLASLDRQLPIRRALGEHFVVDLQARGHRPSRHHQRELRLCAAMPIEVRIEADASAFLDQWSALYDVLVAERSITGLRRFSKPIFAAMLKVPGTLLFTGWEGDTLLGADWYYQDGDRVYAHLSCYSAQGYARAVSYPMMDAALRHFGASARLLDLGGAPTTASPASGLTRFKAGWATHTRPAWLLGAVFDPAGYQRLCGDTQPGATDFFPYHRRRQFLDQPGSGRSP